MFGGDYFDWTKEENKEAVQFLHDLVANKETSIEQIADKYDQMNPKINDGKIRMLVHVGPWNRLCKGRYAWRR